MMCPKCKERLVGIGFTVGGNELFGCPKCKLVYYEVPK